LQMHPPIILYIPEQRNKQISEWDHHLDDPRLYNEI